MNRREALKALVAVSGGITVTPVTTQEAQDIEIVLVRPKYEMDDEECRRFQKAWAIAVEGTSLAPARWILMPCDLDVEFIRAKA